MQYSKYIFFLIIINLIIVFISIFVGNITRKLEISNSSILKDISSFEEKIIINKIEFSFYNNPDYLKKLHNIYFSLEEKNLKQKIISLSSISNTTDEKLILVDLK